MSPFSEAMKSLNHPLDISVYKIEAGQRHKLFASSLDAQSGRRDGKSVFDSVDLLVTKTYNLNNVNWEVLVKESPPPFFPVHKLSTALLLGALLVGIGFMIFAQRERARTQRVVTLVSKRTAELRSLNGILVDDIEQRKAISEELERSQRQLRDLAEHNARVKEDERKRIARDIHDDIGQRMLALRIDLSLMAESNEQHGYSERLRHSVRQLDSVIDAMRGIINELRPSVLDLGLDAAVEWEVAKFSRRTGIACNLDIRDALAGLNDAIATALYRIVQESLTNIMRHAQAKQVTLTLWTENGWIFLRLADDGVGMDPTCRRKSKSFGLIGISERIYALGGAFDTESQPGQGTALIIAVPFAPEMALGVA
jgi:signal transduction histidine kinase